MFAEHLVYFVFLNRTTVSFHVQPGNRADRHHRECFSWKYGMNGVRGTIPTAYSKTKKRRDRCEIA